MKNPYRFIHDRAFLETIHKYVDKHVTINMTDFVNRTQNAKKKGKKKTTKVSEESRWIGAGSMPIFVPPRDANAGESASLPDTLWTFLTKRVSMCQS